MMSFIIRDTAFSPALTGALLYIFTRGPASLRNPLLNRLRTPSDAARLTSVLKWLFAFSIVAQVNRWLSRWAANNWIWRENPGQWQWEKEVAVVTGGSSGIGALITRGLSRKGLKVVVLDIQPLPADLQDYAKYHQCDITDQSQVDRVANSIRSTKGSPSILINNAGIAHAHSILDARSDYLRKLFDVNLLSHFYLIQAFLPDMIAKKKGHIVSTASMASFVTVPNLVDYCATKAGLLSLHEGLGQELKHVYKCPEIKTSVVHPTFARTPLIDSYREALERKPGNIIEPSLVADAVVNQVLSGRGGQIIVPGRLVSATLAKGWPSWMQELLRDFAGRSMVPSG